MVPFDLSSLQKVLEFSDRESGVRCARCMKVCSGETLRFNDQLFHANCLICLGKYTKLMHILISVFVRHFISRVIHQFSFGAENYMFEIRVIVLSQRRTNSARENKLFPLIYRD